MSSEGDVGYPRLCVLMNSVRGFMELWVAVRWVIYFTKIVQSITITSPGGKGTVLELLQCIIYNVISNKKIMQSSKNIGSIHWEKSRL